MSRQDKDRELLAEILRQHEHELDEETLGAFTEWQEEKRHFTPKMSAWLHRVARAVGLEVEEAQNLFSSLSPKRQAEMREKAKGILPWEK